MIVGTAGHIDHGKTTLVRALTGVDTDRLPEEKTRGITIELGYAFLDTPDGGRIGFVDVPGHERLVHTMLAGASGIDFALLVVAADDGVMPQTREHLAVLSLLRIAHGAALVTKADRVDPARVDAVRAEVAALLAPTPLAHAPVLAVSAQRGDGLDAINTLLFDAARHRGRHAAEDAAFRLAIDRAFTLDGIGTVVTGTVHAGRVRVGDELVLVPGETAVRVRSIHAQNRAVDHAAAGERCALGVVGIAKDRIARGQWLTPRAIASATDRLDASLTVWHAEARPLRSGMPVHAHVGSATTLGTLAVLDGDVVMPGATGRVQLVLREPIGAWHGDRVVLRDASASRTIAGGTVLDPFGPTRYRRTAQRLAELDAQALPTAEARLDGLLAVAPYGVDVRRFAAAQGRAVEPSTPGVLRAIDAHGDWALGGALAADAARATHAALARFHAEHPDDAGPDAARLRRVVMPRMPEPLWRALVQRLQADRVITARGAFLQLPEHGARLSMHEERIAQKIAPALADAGYEGAWVRDLARDCGESEPSMRTTLARLARHGDLHQVVKDLYYAAGAIDALASIAREIASKHPAGDVTAAQFRDATGLGRKRAIQVLEYFDRIGLLRRIGDAHKLRADSAWFAEHA